MNNGHLEPEDAGGKFRATNWRDGTYFILHKVWDNGGMVSGWRNGSEYVSYCQRQDYGGLDWEEIKEPSDGVTLTDWIQNILRFGGASDLAQELLSKDFDVNKIRCES